jgi:hypothetical protein
MMFQRWTLSILPVTRRMGMSVELPTVFLTVEIQVGFSSVPMGLPEKNVLSTD